MSCHISWLALTIVEARVSRVVLLHRVLRAVVC